MLDETEILFLDALASRLSRALYADSIKPRGEANPLLTYDDHDRLKKLINRHKLAAWDRAHKRDT